jgi:putative DNA primase/helicase
MKFSDVKGAALGRWPMILESLGVPSWALTKANKPCPGCGGKDRFSFDDKSGNGDYICRGQGDQIAGDGFRLLQHVFGWSAKQSLDAVASVLGIVDGQPLPPKREFYQPKLKPVKRVILEPKRLAWYYSLPNLEGDCIAYLKARNCIVPPSDGDLRSYHHPKGDCIVGLITDPISTQPVSLHYTYVRADGTKWSDREVEAGHTNVGVIRLWPDEAITTGLGIAEGIESALSLAHKIKPVWATINAGNMACFPLLAGIESLTIAADNDQAGLKAAEDCAETWKYRKVRTITPKKRGEDMNDWAMRQIGATHDE